MSSEHWVDRTYSVCLLPPTLPWGTSSLVPRASLCIPAHFWHFCEVLCPSFLVTCLILTQLLFTQSAACGFLFFLLTQPHANVKCAIYLLLIASAITSAAAAAYPFSCLPVFLLYFLLFLSLPHFALLSYSTCHLYFIPFFSLALPKNRPEWMRERERKRDLVFSFLYKWNPCRIYQIETLHLGSLVFGVWWICWLQMCCCRGWWNVAAKSLGIFLINFHNWRKCSGIWIEKDISFISFRCQAYEFLLCAPFSFSPFSPFSLSLFPLFPFLSFLSFPSCLFSFGTCLCVSTEKRAQRGEYFPFSLLFYCHLQPGKSLFSKFVSSFRSAFHYFVCQCVWLRWMTVGRWLSFPLLHTRSLSH